ncbi:hypothetical protein ACFHWD_09645 [Clostridium sp. MT-14]|jgi:hydrogenase-4 membrane subunit HyfE|uniref:hypothetical protein n=1 Tax=unclassified Clostridium TaxID=2614128 RepID=UPI001238FAE1|nr:hypothetical protein [Clostridium sp. HV4-5-A1G]KAA8664583.1 hypothetical protein F3O63_17755 [Clostridium sp. HV4-5-A1G]
MKFFSLIYNGFIWGLLLSIIAFQNEWLEMRINTGIIIPITMALCFIVYFIKSAKKHPLYKIGFKFSIFNLISCVLITILIIGTDRFQILPASIIREGIHYSSLSFSTVNLILSIFFITGLFIIFLSSRSQKHFKYK